MGREDTIKLIELLTLYIDDCKKHQKTCNEYETINELATQIMISDHIRVAKQIQEVLCFKL